MTTSINYNKVSISTACSSDEDRNSKGSFNGSPLAIAVDDLVSRSSLLSNTPRGSNQNGSSNDTITNAETRGSNGQSPSGESSLLFPNEDERSSEEGYGTTQETSTNTPTSLMTKEEAEKNKKISYIVAGVIANIFAGAVGSASICRKTGISHPNLMDADSKDKAFAVFSSCLAIAGVLTILGKNIALQDPEQILFKRVALGILKGSAISVGSVALGVLLGLALIYKTNVTI